MSKETLEFVREIQRLNEEVTLEDVADMAMDLYSCLNYNEYWLIAEEIEELNITV